MFLLRESGPRNIFVVFLKTACESIIIYLKNIRTLYSLENIVFKVGCVLKDSISLFLYLKLNEPRKQFLKMYVLSFYIVLWEGDQIQANAKLSRS